MSITTVAVVVPDDFAMFEFGLACEAFGLDRTADGVPSFDFHVVTPEPGLVRSKMGVSLEVTEDLTFAHTADLVVITPAPLRKPWHPAILELIRETVARDAWLLSVCSGSFALAEAGVLDGRRATTHWMYADAMTRRFPLIEVDPDVLFVQDDRIITSAGTAAGIDACLHLLRQTLGAELTNIIARRMVVPPQRDGGQAQYIVHPMPEARSLSLAPVTDWALENLADELSVDDLARRAHMSPRTFARRFKADHGTTPAAWIARQRIILAQRLLETSDIGMDEIAQRCGFGSAAVLRQNFVRALGTTPTAYRLRFACRDEVVA